MGGVSLEVGVPPHREIQRVDRERELEQSNAGRLSECPPEAFLYQRQTTGAGHEETTRTPLAPISVEAGAEGLSRTGSTSTD